MIAFPHSGLLNKKVRIDPKMVCLLKKSAIIFSALKIF